jgi:hypothetical protein
MRAELGGETVSVGRAGIDAMTATTVDTMSGAVERHAVGWLSRTDIERTVEGLYRKIALPADDSKRLALKTAGNVWVLVTKMFDDAVNAKAREHRVRSDNPASGVRGPERDRSRTRTRPVQAVQRTRRVPKSASIPASYLVEQRGIEPLTSALRTQRSPS